MFTEQAWIIKRAALSPHRTALVDVHTDERWTYSDLLTKIEKWQRFFQTEGCKKGDRIAVLSPNTPELFAILFACGLSGLIYVPLNWRLSIRELTYIVQDCEPMLLMYNDSLEEVANDLNVTRTLSIMTDIAFDDEIGLVENEWMESDPWLMIYTGGTTGHPKGVVLSFTAVNWNAINTIVSWGLNEEDVTINYMPLFHTGGINALSIPILMAGGVVVVGDRFEAKEALLATNRYNATISLFVPTMYQLMIQEPYFFESQFPSMKVFLSGGAPCPQTIYHRFEDKGIRFKEGYGMTEAGPNNFFIRPEIAVMKKGSVGQCMQFNSVKILNDAGEECSPGDVGELYITGKHLFTEYWRNPEETAKNLVNGWLKTGDLAKVDADGDYYIVGRKKEMIISGGENVYPQEVEQCLILYPKVKEAAVVGIDDDKWGELVTACITLVDDDDYTEDELLTHCRSFLGPYKIPKKIIVLRELPKTHVGKIDKLKLRELALTS